MTAELASRDQPSRGIATRSAPRPLMDVVLLVLLFIPPKITLLGSSGGSVRLDDLVLAVVVVRHARLFPLLPHWIRRALPWLALLGAISLSLAVTRSHIGLVSATLYAVRPFEYMATALLGLALVHRDRGAAADRVLEGLTVLLAVLSVLQVAGLKIGVSQFAYQRAAGNLGGPYELAAVSALLLFDALSRRRLLIAAVATLPLVLSSSRTTVVAVALVILLAHRTGLPKFVKEFAVVAVIVSSTFAALGVGSQSPDSLATRLATTRIGQGVQEGCAYAKAVGPIHSQGEYFEAAYARLLQSGAVVGSDASSKIRFARWCLLLTNLRDPMSIAFGYGPSYAGAAVDGQYVRYVVEGGVLGLLAWLLLWAVALLRLDVSLRNGLLALLATGLFIDILTAARPMELFWLLTGIYTARKAELHDQLPTSLGIRA